MSEPTGSVPWLDPITLASTIAAKSQKEVVRHLRKQLTTALEEQEFSASDLKRCVYVIRMQGDFVISYPKGRSPVLYIGRGSALGRLATHLKN